MKNVCSHVLYFQSFIVLFVQASLTNYHALLSSSLQHSTSRAAIHYVTHFCKNSIYFKGIRLCLLCFSVLRLNCKQAKYFMLVWKAQWSKSYSNLLLNLSSPSAFINPVPPKMEREDSIYEHCISSFHILAPCPVWIPITGTMIRDEFIVAPTSFLVYLTSTEICCWHLQKYDSIHHTVLSYGIL